MLAVTAGQWLIIGLGAAVALAGFGLMAVNLAAIVMPRAAGQKGPPRKIVGKPAQLTRRRFLGRALGTGFGLSFTGFGAASLGMLWPSFTGGFGGLITVSDTVDTVKEKIRTEKRPYYFGPGRFYLVSYDPSDDPEGLYAGETTSLGGASLVSEGLMALYQRCVHLGCRVPFCDTSQWFECPCHGSKYNRAGEYKAGPAPRSLDRFPIKVEEGIIHVDTGNAITGPPRGTNTTGQNAEGAFCVELGEAE